MKVLNSRCGVIFVTRTTLWLCLCLFTSFYLDAQQVTRKNIDDLSPTELGAYEHAIQLIRDRSASNPYLLDGYAWQAWVHNVNRVSVPVNNELKQGDQDPTSFYQIAAAQQYADGTYGYPGMCEHGKDIFFVWHRAQFYYFEKILQNTDPEGTIVDSRGNKYATKNIGIPYWNFTRAPSGNKFPKVFENQSSVLYHEPRNNQINPRDTTFTSPHLLANIVREANWNVFGGYPNATEGGYGRFEAEVHNPMHVPYVGGSMANPATAAYDPIFYSFHAYVDYIFEAWIEEHGTEGMTSLRYFLRAQQPTEFNLPDYDPGAGDRPNMGRAELYLDIQKLGYNYSDNPADRILDQNQTNEYLTGSGDKTLVFGKSKISPYYKMYTGGVSWRPEAQGTVTNQPITVRAANRDNPFVFVYEEKDPSSSYRIDLYIHGQKVKANIASEKFQKKYFVKSGVAWLSSDHSSHARKSHKFNLDLTEVVDDLNSRYPGETCTLTIVYNKL
ncbi:MAG: tyrosinase family protein [Cytophagales bacterium]|nr:tyrosinase family protein [Cytophagales bacterium]